MKNHLMNGQRGFTLVEALVALIIMAFGMLALAGMQMSLSRNADVSKQRSEAMRLAQDKMEALRSYTQIATGTGIVSWNGLAGGSDSVSGYTIGSSTVGTNTTYTRTWTLGGSSSDAQRAVNVAISWADRASETQSFSLSSVISQVDPVKAGKMAFPLPENTNLKRPKNRNLNIPIQAIDVGGGKSAYQLPSGFAVVFSNITGFVVEKCTTTNITYANYNDGSANCTTYNAFILAGYVSGAVTNGSSGVATMPTGINVSSITGVDTSNGKTVVCSYGQAQDQNASTSTSPVYIANYQYYVCVIPVATNGTWSGTIRLGGVGVTGNYKVCRVQYTANSFVTANEANNQPYITVNESLDNQNYYIESSNGSSCPSITTSSSSGGTVATQLHQDCRLSQVPDVTNTGNCPATTFNAPSR